MASAGLYVTSHGASCAQLGGTIKSPVVVNYSKCGIRDIQHEPKSIILSEAQEELALELMRCVIQKSGLPSGDVITAISDKDVLVRYFEMAEIPKSERDSAVRFEARKYIPYKIEEVVSSFYVANEKLPGKKMGISFVAAKKDSVGSHIVMLRKLGLKPLVIDASCLALIRLFKLTNQLDPKLATMIFHAADDETAHIYIAKDDVVYLTRTISLTSDIPSSKERIISELEVSRDYFLREYPQLEMGKVILTGEGDLGALKEEVSHDLAVRSELGDPMRILKGNLQLGTDSCVAVGLALLGLRDIKKARINLLPETMIIKKEEFLKPILIRGALILAAIFAIQILFVAQMGSLRDNLSSANERLNSFEGPASLLSSVDLVQKKEVMESKVRFLREIIGARASISDKFSSLADALPEQAFFTEASYREEIPASRGPAKRYPEKVSRKMFLRGMISAASQQEEIALANNYAAALKGDEDFLKGFQDVELKSTKIDKFEGVDVTAFEIDISSK